MRNSEQTTKNVCILDIDVQTSLTSFHSAPEINLKRHFLPPATLAVLKSKVHPLMVNAIVNSKCVKCSHGIKNSTLKKILKAFYVWKTDDLMNIRCLHNRDSKEILTKFSVYFKGLFCVICF